MKFKIGNMCKVEEIKNKYRLKVSFVPTNEEINLNVEDIKILELIIRTYEIFKEKEDEDWDEYCEPIYEHIKECINQAVSDMSYDKIIDEQAIRSLVTEIWTSDYSNECYARPYDWGMTYFDGNGIEYEVEIIK